MSTDCCKCLYLTIYNFRHLSSPCLCTVVFDCVQLLAVSHFLLEFLLCFIGLELAIAHCAAVRSIVRSMQDSALHKSVVDVGGLYNRPVQWVSVILVDSLRLQVSVKTLHTQSMPGGEECEPEVRSWSWKRHLLSAPSRALVTSKRYLVAGNDKAVLPDSALCKSVRSV